MARKLAHAVVASAAVCLPSAAAADARPIAVKLQHGVAVHATPDGPVVGRIAARRPLARTPTVLPLLVSRSRAGRTWLRVRLPRRPNGTTGWIAADGTIARPSPWRIVIDRSRRQAVVFRAGRRVRGFDVVVGKPSTPTPLGHFFVAERVRQPAGSALGPWVLATSAYSNVLQEFAGGPGQIGLHGRTGLPEPLGTASSHGCVRFGDRAVAWLARRARPGTRIRIRR